MNSFRKLMATLIANSNFVANLNVQHTLNIIAPDGRSIPFNEKDEIGILEENVESKKGYISIFIKKNNTDNFEKVVESKFTNKHDREFVRKVFLATIKIIKTYRVSKAKKFIMPKNICDLRGFFERFYAKDFVKNQRLGIPIYITK